MANALESAGLSQEDISKIRHGQNREAVSEFEREGGVNIPMSNALSQAMFETQRKKDIKIIEDEKNKKKIFHEIKNTIVDEAWKKVPFSGPIKNLLFPKFKEEKAHDIWDSL